MTEPDFEVKLAQRYMKELAFDYLWLPQLRKEVLRFLFLFYTKEVEDWVVEHKAYFEGRHLI